MAYSTVKDVRGVLSPSGVSTDPENAGHLPDDQIQAAIDKADGMINGYLAAHYALPLTINGVPFTSDPLLNRISTDLAAYDVTLTLEGGNPMEDSDPVVRRHKDAMANLTAIQMQNMILLFDQSGAAQSQGEVFVQNPYEGTMFGPQDFGRPGPGGSTNFGSGTNRRSWGAW